MTSVLAQALATNQGFFYAPCNNLAPTHRISQNRPSELFYSSRMDDLTSDGYYSVYLNVSAISLNQPGPITNYSAQTPNCYKSLHQL